MDNERLVYLYNSWMTAKDKAESLEEALEDLDAPPDPEYIPGMRERLANLERQAQEFHEQFLAAGGVAQVTEEDTEQTLPQESNRQDQEQQLAALREQVDAALRGDEHRHITFP